MASNCPACGSRRKSRVARKWWMRMIPFSKRYRCLACDQAFMAFTRN